MNKTDRGLTVKTGDCSEAAGLSAASVMSRRQCLRVAAGMSLAGFFSPWTCWARSAGKQREYHVCLSPEAILKDPEFPGQLKQAGISCVWLAGFFYGHWPWPVQDLDRARTLLHGAGLEAAVVNVPLGHPGDSLGARDAAFPLTPPLHWRTATTVDGKQFAGTSLHPPATEENARALRELRRMGASKFFLDDDFRLARSPGEIGGCFCNGHRDRFLRRAGLASSRWPELLDDVRVRRATSLLRTWIEFNCDELSASFRVQQRAAAGGLGIMVMYLGAEKAGIRLADYRDVPFRVGEIMFDDASFGKLKGKTDELFSVLFHRRFVASELAYSETTAYPPDRLSAANLAAKLAISTIADVRHTLFMSGVTPFDKGHWSTLAEAMTRQADFHKELAGHKLRGPLKHYWGEASRLTGDDRPFSLFLAAGIPFEVTDKPARDGWTFLADLDAKAVAEGRLASRGTIFLSPSQPPPAAPGFRQCEESFEALLALKHNVVAALKKTPYVANDVPAVLAWYPSRRAALLWNPDESRETFAVRCGGHTREIALDPLASTLIRDLPAE